MYSTEILHFLMNRNYILNSEEYEYISNTELNPQINHIIYDGYNNNIQMHTNDGFYFEFKVVCSK